MHQTPHRLNVVPRGIGDMLLWLAARYGNPDVFITENGVDVPGESALPLQEALRDGFRVLYLEEYLQHVMRVKEEDGVQVRGYFAWSLLVSAEERGGIRVLGPDLFLNTYLLSHFNFLMKINHRYFYEYHQDNFEWSDGYNCRFGLHYVVKFKSCLQFLSRLNRK